MCIRDSVRCLPLLRIRHAERELADRIGCHNGHAGQFRQHAALARSPILEKLCEHDLVSAARAAHGQSDRRRGCLLYTSLERAHAQSLADRHRERIHRQTDCDQKQLQ